MGSTHYGRLEYNLSGEWISVCGRQWNNTLSETVCRIVSGNFDNEDCKPFEIIKFTSMPKFHVLYSAIITSHVSGEVLNRSVQLIYISGELQEVRLENTPCPAINIICKGVVLSSPFLPFTLIHYHTGSCTGTGFCTCTHGFGGSRCNDGQLIHVHHYINPFGV